MGLPMPSATLGQGVLSRLVRNLGGVRGAARKLDIPEDLLERYLDGKRAIPERIWLRAVDMLMADLTAVRRPASNAERDSEGSR